MRLSGVASVFMVFCAGAHAQPLNDLLLPESVQIKLRVVDAEGKPIPNAGVGHTDYGVYSAFITTDSDGKLEFQIQRPAFVVRKPGEEST